MMTSNKTLLIRDLGLINYQQCWEKMRDFTLARNEDTTDELWFAEHPAVFTQGLNGKAEHILAAGDIPVIHTDRGGQVTYHGPGQLMVYPLLNLKRQQLGVRDLVTKIEQLVVTCLSHYQIHAHGDPCARGVYVGDAKICSIGLRIKRHCAYHGLALNVNMDLSPFKRINPCGFSQLTLTQIADLGGPTSLDQVKADLIPLFKTTFNFTNIESHQVT